MPLHTHHQDLRKHTWWAQVPPDKKPILFHQSRNRQLLEWGRKKSVRLNCLLTLYVFLSLVPLWLGSVSLTIVSMIPLAMVAALGGLAWWLTWVDFHD